ncbi:MAG: SH3-like domain-containing protein [Ignavibacteriales bacterium]|nr:MAG: SH3-like domain-containing protein [Ignavibacteriales bacterium]
MKKLFYFAIVLFLITGCENKEQTENINQNTKPGTRAVTVTEKLDASNYTYLNVEENGQKFWIAVPQMEVKEGETLYFTKSMEMKDFKSETLNKTFESVLFVEDISRIPQVNKEQLSNVHSVVGSATKENIKVEPLADGYTIEKIFSEKESLSGKIVKVKGVVVKVNSQIMNRNWIHLQDGTGAQGNFDLMVTSNDEVEVGQVVVAEGKVTVNKDFGSGYSYAVLLEEAKVKPE